jgi:hypothetical protein
VYWRWENLSELIPDGLDISHINIDQTVLDLVAEDPDLNESRKYCHHYGQRFGWTCPHTYKPCTF